MELDMKVYEDRSLKRADSKSVLRFTIRRLVVELQGDKHFFAYRQT